MMDRNSVLINVLGFWFMLALIFYIFVMGKLWAMHRKARDGYISFRRYRAYRHDLGKTCLKVLLASIAIAVLLYVIIMALSTFPK